MGDKPLKQVWKFPLKYVPGVKQRVGMPEGAELLCLQLQDGRPTLWALCDPSAPKVARVFEIVGTGWEVAEVAAYVGTYQLPPLVWHLFERTKTDD